MVAFCLKLLKNKYGYGRCSRDRIEVNQADLARINHALLDTARNQDTQRMLRGDRVGKLGRVIKSIK
jgi:hypothetical protein